MDRPPDPARCDRGRDLLQGDQVLLRNAQGLRQWSSAQGDHVLRRHRLDLQDGRRHLKAPDLVGRKFGEPHRGVRPHRDAKGGAAGRGDR